jgi:hypothetical protein
MVIRGPFLSHLTLARQHFVKNSSTAFHENPINPIVTDTVSTKRGWGRGGEGLGRGGGGESVSTEGIHFCYVNNTSKCI